MVFERKVDSDCVLEWLASKYEFSDSKLLYDQCKKDGRICLVQNLNLPGLANEE